MNSVTVKHLVLQRCAATFSDGLCCQPDSSVPLLTWSTATGLAVGLRRAMLFASLIPGRRESRDQLLVRAWLPARALPIPACAGTGQAARLPVRGP